MVLASEGNLSITKVLHCLVGELNSTALEFVLTDDLGSVRTAITTQAGAATVAGSMGYGPFGFVQYHAGQTGTNKGYTGQYTDPLSGLGYYVAWGIGAAAITVGLIAGGIVLASIIGIISALY
jgi:hypothetical protein